MSLFSKKIVQPEIGREYPDQNENEIVSEMVALTKIQMERLYKNTQTLRQVHAKMHGCVKASFTIENDLPDELRVGIFKECKTYPAWIRYSNGTSKINPDKKNDTRGMAIKLMNLPGERLLDSMQFGSTIDLVLASSPFFFAKNLTDFMGLLKASIAKYDKLMVLLYFVTHWKIAYRTLAQILIKCNNPLEIPYFSGTPYQFGDETRAVKYHVRPAASNSLVNIDLEDDNYLRKNMSATLSKNDLYFDFFIQFQTDAVKMPIEDATVTWTSPFIKVATIHIPAQVFDTEMQDEFAEKLTYNIWRTLPEHRPLGSFNRGRRFIYRELYKFRADRNLMHLDEPNADADFLEPENLKGNGHC